MIDIAEKITAIINHFNLNNYAFSKRIGVTGTTIDSIVNGRPQNDGSRKKTKPGYDVLKAIIDEFDINPDYLFGKSHTMLKSETPKIQTYTGVPQVIAVNNNDQENVIYVPVKARAGYLDGYCDTEYIEKLPSFYMPQLTNGTFRCFEVQGNSMLRTFYDGDLVFGKYVENLNDIKDGHVSVIVSKNDGIVLKRILKQIKQDNKLVLKSDNKDGNYPDYNINTEEIMEVWYVTMYASKQMQEPVDIHNRLEDLENQLHELKTSVTNKANKN